MKEWNWIKVW